MRQLLFLTTVLGLMLAVFRHPIRLLLEEPVWKAAVAPWSLLGNLLWGAAIVNPKPFIKTDVAAAVAFTISTPLMVITLVMLITVACGLVRRAWIAISDD